MSLIIVSLSVYKTSKLPRNSKRFLIPEENDFPSGTAITLIFLTVNQPASFSEEDTVFMYNAHNKRDPMWPLVNAGGSVVNYDSDLSVSDLNLEGIMSDNNQQVALINGRIVKVNDKIGNYVLVQINSNSVVLESNGQTYSLILKKEE